MRTREYRLMIERPGLHEPSAFFTTQNRRIVEAELAYQRRKYETREPNTRMWMECRTVGPWFRVGLFDD